MPSHMPYHHLCLASFAVITTHVASCRHHTAKGIDCAQGSPGNCWAQRIRLQGRFSAGKLIKVTNGLRVSKSTQKNSCPKGWKIWSPRNQQDWQTVLDSTSIPSAPHLIVDVTRPSNGCGGCTRYAMKSTVDQQSSWVTSDGSPWWLRDTKYKEPNGDYKANCYLHISAIVPTHVEFNDKSCSYSSNSYLCQRE